MSFNSLLHSLIEIPRIHSRKINTDSPGAFTQCMTDPLLNQTYCQRVSSALWVTVRDFVVTLKNKKVLKQAACRLRSSQLLRHVAQQQRAFTFVVFARHDKDMFFFAHYNQYRGLYFNIFHPKNNCWALNCWWDRSSRTVLILHGMNSTRWWKHFLRVFCPHWHDSISQLVQIHDINLPSHHNSQVLRWDVVTVEAFWGQRPHCLGWEISLRLFELCDMACYPLERAFKGCVRGGCVSVIRGWTWPEIILR